MGSLAEFFDRACADGEPIVAGWVIATEGSTYRKAGALMLFTQSERCGLLSGGCLEGDLHEHARHLLNSGTRLSLHRYDSRGSDDPIWGLGLGCEGLMQVLLLHCPTAQDHEPIKSLLAAEQRREPLACAIDLSTGHFVCVDADGALTPHSTAHSTALKHAALDRLKQTDNQSPRAGWVLGTQDPSAAGATPKGGELPSGCFSFKNALPASLLICGAGPDIAPVVFFARQLGWHISVVDHRPAYIDGSRIFENVHSVLLDSPAQLAEAVSLNDYSAALVMSHHLQADGAYLTSLAESMIPYIGLLGPAARRERLFVELGPKVAALRPRLRAPVGLDIGAQTPEEIALAIVAEIQASLRDRTPRSFTTAVAPPSTK